MRHTTTELIMTTIFNHISPIYFAIQSHLRNYATMYLFILGLSMMMYGHYSSVVKQATLRQAVLDCNSLPTN